VVPILYDPKGHGVLAEGAWKQPGAKLGRWGCGGLIFKFVKLTVFDVEIGVLLDLKSEKN
jgi:hypothetical protein